MLDIHIVCFKNDNYPLLVAWDEEGAELLIESLIGQWHSKVDREDFQIHRMVMPDLHYTILRILQKKGLFPADNVTCWSERNLSPGSGGELILQAYLGSGMWNDPLQEMMSLLKIAENPLTGLDMPYSTSIEIKPESQVEKLLERFNT